MDDEEVYRKLFEEVKMQIFFRDVWSDEFHGEKYDIKPYKKLKGADGKYTNSTQLIELDENKKYKVFFLSKTRNDEKDITLVYEFLGAWNQWKEIGFCNVRNDHV